MMEHPSSPERRAAIPPVGPKSAVEHVASASVGGNSGEITVPGGTPEEPHNPESPAPPVETTPAEALHTTPQTALEAAGFVLPRNRARLLDDNLVPSGLPGNETDKYYVRGYPDILVRRDTDARPDEFASAQDAVQRMSDYGIDVLPHERLFHDGHAYMMTAKVTGASAHELLHDNPNDALVGDVDKLFSKIGAWLLTETQESRPLATDVMDTRQYMRGTIAGQTEQKMWLTDLPVRVHDNRDYAYDTAMFANCILETEQQAGVRLEAGRQALLRAVEYLPAVSQDPDRATGMILIALASNTPMDFDAISGLQ